jgi:DNA-directed RNA polymerase subunit alpha
MFNIPQVNFKVVKKDSKTGVFEFAPLTKGFGYSLGSSLRRTLFSASMGAAITKVRIEGVSHQFSTIEGAKDDVLHMLLNLKKVRFAKTNSEPVELELHIKGAGDVTAGDIEETSDVKVVNKNLVITSLAEAKSKLRIFITVESGTGYRPVEEGTSAARGTILMDADFSPIVNVSITVDDHRVGRDSNYDKLTLIVETDGSKDSEQLVRNAAKALKEYFHRIETGEDYIEEAIIEAANEEPSTNNNNGSVSSLSIDEIALEELHLPTRTINALRKAGIKTLGDLADRNETDLFKIRNLGEKSIKEILALLEKENLR